MTMEAVTKVNTEVERDVKTTEAVKMKVNMEAETGGRNMEKADRTVETTMIALAEATRAEGVVEMMITHLDTRGLAAVETMINHLDTREAATVGTMIGPLDTQVEEVTAGTTTTKEAETILADWAVATMTTTVDMINARPEARVAAMAETTKSRDLKKQSATTTARVAPMTDQVDMVVTTAVRLRAEAVAMRDMEATRARMEGSSLLEHLMEELAAMVVHLTTIQMLLSMLSQALVIAGTPTCLVWPLACSTRTRRTTRTLTKTTL